jgi:predicted choloylglycine hydrolase
MNLKERYQLNKTIKVGVECVCPSCNTKFIKSSYQQVFCKSKNGTICKDKYWNTVDPKKRNNTTRISPASQRWLNKQEKRIYDRRYNDFDDDPSWDAHKDSF